jgi:hypothetical protein
MDGILHKPRTTGIATLLLALVVMHMAGPAEAQLEGATAQLEMGLDVSILRSTGHPSWLEGSAGKLRFDPDNDGFKLSRGFLEYEGLISDTVKAHFMLEAYDDGFSSPIDLTEGYLEWRPVPRSANRYRIKFGAFYPRISLENTGPGWSSPYSISPSAINTWVGEELRSVGMEFSWSRRLKSLGDAHTFSLNAAVFGGNDPAGGLIAWKGWSIHDRQSRFNDEVPLPPIPRIQPGQWWDEQDPFITPLLEIDEEPGYYVNAEWRYSNRFLLRAMHYDNRADPQGVEDNQFAWWTYFDHVGMQTTLPGGIGLLAQWMDGFTAWGRFRNGVYSVDVTFLSHYVLLTRAFDRHRVTARYDHFEIAEADTTPLDENSERGHGWTLSYQYAPSDNVTLVAEWVQVFSERPAWAYFDLDERQTETQLQLAVRLHFGQQF